MRKSIYPKESREAAANVLSACACECCATPGSLPVFIAPFADILLRDLDAVIKAEAIELAGLAWLETNMDLEPWSVAELYAEAEALVRSGWEPSDDD